MAKLLTAAQMRLLEKRAIDAGHVTGLELMERAGTGVVDAMLRWRPQLAAGAHRAVVLCGPGNNGGDGFVVARLLKRRGWSVEVYLYGRDPAETDELPPDAAENARRWRESGDVERLEPEAVRATCASLSEGDILLDALFGTGLTRPVSVLPQLLEADGSAPGNAEVVAVDMPSGVCSDSGRPIVEADGADDRRATIRADLTVTFHAPKLGQMLAQGPAHCGRLSVAGIGLADADGDPEAARESVLAGPLSKDAGSHKYAHGHALVLSGGVGKGGAARMAARGALRIGAGLVTVGCPPAALQENASALDAIMLTALQDADALEEFLPKRKVGAVCIGPGFGHGERLRAFLTTTLRARVPTVLDADAISEFADDPGALFEMLHDGCVMTPHQGEFGRLFPDILDKLTGPATEGPAHSKVDAAREAAARAGCTVLFKGADTVIAEPSGRAAVNGAHYERSAPWLATAGAGDVLSGFIAGLLARGLPAPQAAETGARLHVGCALEFGPGLVAEDLPELLPGVLRKLAS